MKLCHWAVKEFFILHYQRVGESVVWRGWHLNPVTHFIQQMQKLQRELVECSIFSFKKKKNRIFLKYCNRWHNTAWFNTHRTVTSFWFVSQVFLFCYITHIILLMCYICDTNVNRSWSWTDPAWSTQQRHTQSEVNKPKNCT